MRNEMDQTINDLCNSTRCFLIGENFPFIRNNLQKQLYSIEIASPITKTL